MSERISFLEIAEILLANFQGLGLATLVLLRFPSGLGDGVPQIPPVSPALREVPVLISELKWMPGLLPRNHIACTRQFPAVTGSLTEGQVVAMMVG